MTAYLPSIFSPRKLRTFSTISRVNPRMSSIKSFRRHDEFFSLSLDITVLKQPFDNLCSCRRRAEAALPHRFAQFFVFNEVAGALHGREQSRLVETRRWLGLLFLDLDLEHFCRFVRQNRHHGLLAFPGRFASIHCQPARIDNYLSFSFERLAIDTGDARSHFKLRRWIKHRD